MRSSLKYLAGVALTLWATSAAFACDALPWSKQQKLIASDGGTVDMFAAAVAVDDGTAVVGSPLSAVGGPFTFTGAAYVFERSPSGWVEAQKLTAQDGQNGDRFGKKVAIHQNTIVVAASRDTNQNGVEAGAIYIWSRQGTVWAPKQKILASDGAADDEFGRDVAVHKDTIVASSFGSVYVFVRTGSTWTEQVRLDPSFLGTRFVYGSGVDIFEDTAIASNQTDQLVFVFERQGTSWTETAVLAPNDVVSGNGFGWSVGLHDDTVVVGTPFDGDLGCSAGAAYVFGRQGSGWIQEAKLFSVSAAPLADFGVHAAASRDRVIVGGSVAAQSPAVPAAHVFARIAGSWCQVAEITVSDPDVSTAYAGPVDIDGSTVISGDSFGSGSFPDSGAGYIHLVEFPPASYCTAKMNSQGCLPHVSGSGNATLTGPDDFLILVRDTLEAKPGLFFWGTSGTASAPFLGGTLCVQPPLKRTPVQFSSGDPSGGTCEGGYAFLFSQALMQSQGLLAGQEVHGQFWMRDPAHPDGTGVALSNGVKFTVYP